MKLKLFKILMKKNEGKKTKKKEIRRCFILISSRLFTFPSYLAGAVPLDFFLNRGELLFFIWLRRCVVWYETGEKNQSDIWVSLSCSFERSTLSHDGIMEGKTSLRYSKSIYFKRLANRKQEGNEKGEANQLDSDRLGWLDRFRQRSMSNTHKTGKIGPLVSMLNKKKN